MLYEQNNGVPRFEEEVFGEKLNKYALLIPVINEGDRIIKELVRADKAQIHKLADIIICDGASTDKSVESERLKALNVNTLLIKRDKGKQAAQLRMGIWWALKRGYEGIITIDGNNKDSIEDVGRFVKGLGQGFDFIQGSRFIKGGCAVNTPLLRYLAVRLIHSPIISLTAGYFFTDTTNAFRGYSARYLKHNRVQPFRDVFNTYELLAYLSVRASQLGLRVCEVPVARAYPKNEKTPTKINSLWGHLSLFIILLKNAVGAYEP